MLLSRDACDVRVRSSTLFRNLATTFFCYFNIATSRIMSTSLNASLICQGWRTFYTTFPRKILQILFVPEVDVVTSYVIILHAISLYVFMDTYTLYIWIIHTYICICTYKFTIQYIHTYICMYYSQLNVPLHVKMRKLINFEL